MEALISQLLLNVTGVGAYGLVLVILLLCGLGLPLPEDVVLITGGFLVYEGAARLDLMMLIAFLGILGGDSIAFLLGRRLGDRLEKVWPFRTFITPQKRHKVEGLFARYGQKIVVAARFMPGVRAVTFFLAGGAGMRYLTFLFYDGLAALVSAPVFVFLGWHYGANIERVIHAVRQGQWAVIGGVLALVAVWYGIKTIRRRLQERMEASQNPTPPAAAVLRARPLQTRGVATPVENEAQAAK